MAAQQLKTIAVPRCWPWRLRGGGRPDRAWLCGPSACPARSDAGAVARGRRHFARGVQNGLFPIAKMTTDVADAIRGVDLIMLVVQSSAHAHYAAALAG